MHYTEPTATQPTNRIENNINGISRRWIAWIPASDTNFIKVERSLLKKRINIKRSIDQSGAFVSDHVMDAVQKATSNYFPSFPTKSLLLKFEDEDVRVLPLRFGIYESGIAEGCDAWREISKQLILEPSTWIIQSHPDRLELWERSTDKYQLTVCIHITNGSRYSVIRIFLSSAIRIYSEKPGPVLLIGKGDGIMELDCWIISKYLSVQVCIGMDYIRDHYTWWESINKTGRLDFWRSSWIRQLISSAVKQKKTITNTHEASIAIQKKRVQMVINPFELLETYLSDDKLMTQLVTNPSYMINIPGVEPFMVVR